MNVHLPQPQPVSEPVRLGLMSPMSGIVGIYGPEINWAARIACDEINEQGGVLGNPLELIIIDDGSLPQTAVPAAQKLIDEYQCVAIIGNLLSNSRISVLKQVAEPYCVPLLNFSFYEGSLLSHYFFHFAALPNQQIDCMIPYMAEHFGPKMFFAGNNYEWPRGSIDAAKHALAKMNGEVIGEEYFEIGIKRSSVDNLLNRVARSGADIFVPYFAGIDQITLLTRFTELGLKNRMAVVMGHYDEVMVSKMPPSVREGFYSSNTYFMSVDTPENGRYLQQLQQQPDVTGIWPNGNGILTNFGEGAYLCVHAFAKALQVAGKINTEALIDALRTVSVKSPQGAVTMCSRLHHAKVNNYLSRCNADGTFTIIQAFKSIAPLIPGRYQHPIKTGVDDQAPLSQDRKDRPFNDDVRQILSLIDMLIIITDEEGLILEANPSACQLFDYAYEDLIGHSIQTLFPPNLRVQNTERIIRFVTSREENQSRLKPTEMMGARKDGTFVVLKTSVAKYYRGNEVTLVFNMLDITQHKHDEEILVRQSTNDALTGLPNRALIYDRLSNAMKRSIRSQKNVAILFIDLDNFKLINDTHGHNVGDTLLQKVSERLLHEVRPGDTVGRLAGDEFVVICEQIDESHMVSSLAIRINDVLRQPLVFDHLQLFISASIGIAIGNGNQFTAEDLLRSADSAMYVAKQKGRDNWQLFDEHLQQDINQKHMIIHGLRQALDKDEFSVCFQPIIATTDRRIVGAELLLRWQTKQGPLSPDIFIPLAETIGVISVIGSWVFREGCKAEVNWRRQWGEHAPYVSINLSTRQLNEKHLVNNFRDILLETGADPQRILLEITETSLMTDVEANLIILKQLAALGMRVAVDDFGTGYSSLAQLSRLPVSVLKIDQSFIHGIENDDDKHMLVRTIIGLGHSLGLKIIAEGIETEIQFSTLRQLRCNYIQGYFYSPPMYQEAFVKKIDDAVNNRFFEENNG